MMHSLRLAILLIVSFGCFLVPDALAGSPAERGYASAWGQDASGQLGRAACCASSPLPIPVAGLTDVTSIAAGDRHALALEANGTVWAWGSNDASQLGTGKSGLTTTPEKVPVVTGVKAIAAGSAHSLALGTQGRVWAWGDNAGGDLGVGDEVPRDTPTRVPHLNRVVKIAATDDLSVALRNDGTVWTWGFGDSGQLGNGGKSNSDVPVKVRNLRNVVAIAAGSDHVLAVTADGAAWSWGDNFMRMLGNVTAPYSTVPVRVWGNGGKGYLSGAVAAAAPWNDSAVLKSDGTVWVWGSNTSGLLGNGTISKSPAPYPQPVPGLSGVKAIAATASGLLALRRDGTVVAWGADSFGELGIGTFSQAPITRPAQVRGIRDALAIGAGPYNGFAITTSPVIPPVPPHAKVCTRTIRPRALPAVILSGNPTALAVSRRTGHVFVASNGTYDPRSGNYVCLSTFTTFDGRGASIRTITLGRGLGVSQNVPSLAVDDWPYRAYVLNSGDISNRSRGALSTVDSRTGRLVKTVGLGGDPFNIAIDSNTGRLVVPSTTGTSSRVTLLDAPGGTVLAGIPVDTAGPAAADSTHHRAAIIAPDGSSVRLLNTKAGATVKTVSLPGGQLGGFGVDPKTARLFVATSSGPPDAGGSSSPITILDTVTGRVLQTRSLPVGTSIGPVIVDVPSNRVLVGEQTPSGKMDTIVLDASRGQILRRLPITMSAADIASNGTIYALTGPRSVTILQPTGWRILRVIHIGQSLTSLALDEPTHRLFVIDSGAHAVRVLCAEQVCG